MTCLKTNRNIGASTGSACWLVTCHPLLVLACQLSPLLVTCHPCPSVAFFICHLSFFADHSSGTAAAEVLLSNICTVDSIYLFVIFIFICHFGAPYINPLFVNFYWLSLLNVFALGIMKQKHDVIDNKVFYGLVKHNWTLYHPISLTPNTLGNHPGLKQMYFYTLILILKTSVIRQFRLILFGNF